MHFPFVSFRKLKAYNRKEIIQLIESKTIYTIHTEPYMYEFKSKEIRNSHPSFLKSIFQDTEKTLESSTW